MSCDSDWLTKLFEVTEQLRGRAETCTLVFQCRGQSPLPYSASSAGAHCSKSKMAGRAGKGCWRKYWPVPAEGAAWACVLGNCSPGGHWSWVEPSVALWLPAEFPASPTLLTGLQASRDPPWGHPPQARLLLTQWKLPSVPSPAHSSWAFMSCHVQAGSALQVTLNQLKASFLPFSRDPGEMPRHSVASRVTSPLPPPSSAPEPSPQNPGQAELGCQGETGREQYYGHDQTLCGLTGNVFTCPNATRTQVLRRDVTMVTQPK